MTHPTPEALVNRLVDLPSQKENPFLHDAYTDKFFLCSHSLPPIFFFLLPASIIHCPLNEPHSVSTTK